MEGQIGLDVSEARRLKALEDENARLKRCCPMPPDGGSASANVNEGVAWEVYVENLHHAVERFRGRQPNVLIELISKLAVPGYFLSHADQAVRIIELLTARLDADRHLPRPGERL